MKYTEKLKNLIGIKPKAYREKLSKIHTSLIESWNQVQNTPKMKRYTQGNVTVEVYPETIQGKQVWFVGVSGDKSISDKEFGSQSEATAFAKKYMDSHKESFKEAQRYGQVKGVNVFIMDKATSKLGKPGMLVVQNLTGGQTAVVKQSDVKNISTKYPGKESLKEYSKGDLDYVALKIVGVPYDKCSELEKKEVKKYIDKKESLQESYMIVSGSRPLSGFYPNDIQGVFAFRGGDYMIFSSEQEAKKFIKEIEKEVNDKDNIDRYGNYANKHQSTAKTLKVLKKESLQEATGLKKGVKVVTIGDLSTGDPKFKTIKKGTKGVVVDVAENRLVRVKFDDGRTVGGLFQQHLNRESLHKEGGYGILSGDQSDVLDGIVMGNKNKDVDSVFRIVKSDPFFKGVSDNDLKRYVKDSRRLFRIEQSINEEPQSLVKATPYQEDEGDFDPWAVKKYGRPYAMLGPGQQSEVRRYSRQNPAGVSSSLIHYEDGIETVEIQR